MWETAWSYLTNRKWESATVDEWKQAAESAYISAEITRIANEVGHDLPGGDISTVAGMLGAVPLPVLGQNKHDK